jgi:cysteine-rich repeat protein
MAMIESPDPPNHRNLPLLLISASGLLLSSCSGFDPALYQSREGVADSENWSAIEDRCPVPDVEVLSSDSREHGGTVYLNTLADDVQNVGKLTGVNGPDGVLGFTLAAFERVSISADFVATPGQMPPYVDLALYLLGACDSAAFLRRNDRCTSGLGEDIWWQMDAPSNYYLGFDSRAYDQTMLNPAVDLTVTFPRYGDGVVVKGEACDDSNVNDGDGCTHDGLHELQNTGVIMQEKEPNNHPWGGNVVMMSPAETARISGYIGGNCDNDFFAIDVPEGAFPRVTMLRGDGKDCGPETPTITLEFNRLVGSSNVEQVKLGDATIPAANGGTSYCPAFDETTFAESALPAGRYVAEMKGYHEGESAFHYLLSIEMLPAAAPAQ